jgi:cytochrome c553
MIFIRSPAVTAIVMVLTGLLSVCSAKAEAHTDAPATFIGAEACAGCHAAETERWKTSHHAHAMQRATVATVLGDFANATVTNYGFFAQWRKVHGADRGAGRRAARL